LIGLSPIQQLYAEIDPRALQKKLESVFRKSGLPTDSVGLSIRSLKDPKQVVFDQGGDRKMIPASLSKIFTAGAVLAHFTPGHKFVTELYSEGKTSGTTLEGDLCLKGGGDPGFVSESMWFLVNEFLRENVSKITGAIKVDTSKFDQNYFDPSRLSKRVDRAYDSPVSAMSFNWNAVNFYIRPANKVGEPVKIFADPANSYIEIINKAKTVSGKTDDVRVSSLGLSKDGQTEKFLVDGVYGINRSERVHFRAVEDPTIWSGKNLKNFLSQRQIEIGDKVIKGSCSSSAKLVAKAESKSLPWMVADMMKFSNNFVAETLAKNLAQDVYKKPGSIESAMKHTREWLSKDFDIASKDFSLVNPSGLTNDNQFKVADISSFLAKFDNKSSQTAEFISSFPIMGRDGTVKSRLKDTQAQDWIRAKTGLLNGVVGLAGYVHYPEQPPLAFAFVFNGPAGSTEKARHLFDNLLLALNDKK
jgi:D-alanyl-D-alanine carboxypeptidase/D-alanyl-D-alanine-endopeptidase (penicillin-binding protein 4)